MSNNNEVTLRNVSHETQELSDEFPNTCAVCKWGYLRCLNPDSEAYNKRVVPTDSCVCFKHWYDCKENERRW